MVPGRLACVLFGLALLAACRGRTPPEATKVVPEPGSAPLAAPRGPRLAYASGRSVCFQRLAADALPPPACTALPDAVAQLVWVDRDEIAVVLASGGVMRVGERGARTVALPPEATWDRPPPRDANGNVALGAEQRSDKRHLFVSGGEVWLAKCPWWFIFDAGGCHEWVSARLSGSPATRVEKGDPPGFRDPPATSFDAGDVPSDVSIRVDGARLVCRRGGSGAVFVPEVLEPVPSLSWSWVPGSASHYLLTVTYDHIEIEQSSVYWMKACDAKPERELTGIVIGSDGFWGHHGDKGWVLRHGDREIAVIDGELPVFGAP